MTTLYRKINRVVTDGRTDAGTDRRTNGRTDGQNRPSDCSNPPLMGIKVRVTSKNAVVPYLRYALTNTIQIYNLITTDDS